MTKIATNVLSMFIYQCYQYAVFVEYEAHECAQVKVWLGTNADHYYILSRFLISRMLLVTKVPLFSHSASSLFRPLGPEM